MQQPLKGTGWDAALVAPFPEELSSQSLNRFQDSCHIKFFFCHSTINFHGSYSKQRHLSCQGHCRAIWSHASESSSITFHVIIYCAKTSVIYWSDRGTRISANNQVQFIMTIVFSFVFMTRNNISLICHHHCTALSLVAVAVLVVPWVLKLACCKACWTTPELAGEYIEQLTGNKDYSAKSCA